jgi:ribosomal protein S18 acetylase RimI-like enzyme
MVGWGHGYRDLLLPSPVTSRPPTPEHSPPAQDQLILRNLDAATFVARLPELVSVYVAAMRYPDGISTARAALWQEHSQRPGFAAFVAVDAQDRIRGLTYGYAGRPGQWWFSEVARGLGRADSPWLANYLELTELHVRPDSQGAGIGEALLTALLTNRSEGAVLLSTPEGTNRAWRLYRRMGFVDVLRQYRFAGDPRPFGVLGRTLPLDAPGHQPGD